MNVIIDNWFLIVAVVAIIVIAVLTVISFFQKPTPQQYAQIREWLLFAVTSAEKQFGSQMGKIKLRYVYDKFLERFDYLAKLISFEKFSELVDSALEEMKKLLESNKKAQEYVGIEQSPTSEEEKKEETIFE